MKAKYLFLLPALVYTGLILYLSLINLADTPVKDLGMSDKMMHGGAYFGLGLLWMWYFIFAQEENRIFKNVLWVSLFSILFGIFIEVLQDNLTNYRQLDFYDVLANTIGVIFAALVIWLLRRPLIRLKAKINLIFIKK